MFASSNDFLGFLLFDLSWHRLTYSHSPWGLEDIESALRLAYNLLDADADGRISYDDLEVRAQEYQLWHQSLSLITAEVSRAAHERYSSDLEAVHGASGVDSTIEMKVATVTSLPAVTGGHTKGADHSKLLKHGKLFSSMPLASDPEKFIQHFLKILRIEEKWDWQVLLSTHFPLSLLGSPIYCNLKQAEP